MSVPSDIKQSHKEEKETIRRYTKRRNHAASVAKTETGERKLRVKRAVSHYTEIIKDEREHLDTFADDYYGITGMGI